MFDLMNSRRLGRGRLVLVLGLGLALLMLGGIVLLLSRPKLPPTPKPDPNAADTYADISQMIVGLELFYQNDTAVEDWENVDSLRSFIEANAAAYEKLSLACGQDCVPFVDYEQGFSDANLNDAMGQFRASTYLPRIAARLASLEGRPNDAAKHYTDLFILGAKYGQHGLWVHAHVGLAMERLGLQRLMAIVESLDKATAAKVKSKIEAGRHQSLDYDAMHARDRVLANKQHGAVQASYMRFALRGAPDQVKMKTQAVEAEVLQLQADLLDQLH